MSEWISVDTVLPEDGQRVLILINPNSYDGWKKFGAAYYDRGYFECDDNTLLNSSDVIYWMIPVPPTQSTIPNNWSEQDDRN